MKAKVLHFIKQKWTYRIIFLIIGIAVAKIAISTFSTGFLNPQSEAYLLDHPEDLPHVKWRDLNNFDYKTGKGPKKVMELDGKLVRMPGYVVPLTDNVSILKDFLIVPDAQSCIHVPPPPPNLIVTTVLREPIPIKDAWNPAWIIGYFKIEPTESKYGGSAFKLDAIKIEKFEFKQ